MHHSEFIQMLNYSNALQGYIQKLFQNNQEQSKSLVHGFYCQQLVFVLHSIDTVDGIPLHVQQSTILLYSVRKCDISRALVGIMRNDFQMSSSVQEQHNSDISPRKINMCQCESKNLSIIA